MQHLWYNSTLFYQQDKEGGINPIFDCPRMVRSYQAGNPLIFVNLGILLFELIKPVENGQQFLAA